MWWPIWIALTLAVIVLTALVRDRSAMVGAIIVLGGLLAMQAGWSPQVKHLAALTIWAVCCALIVISTNVSILALTFAIAVAACYTPVVLGLDPRDWYRASDIAGICLLLSLGGSGILTWMGGASADRGFVASGALPEMPARAYRAFSEAFAGAPPKALEDL